MKSLFGGSAVIAASLLSSSFLLSATPSAAETPFLPTEVQTQKSEATKTQPQNGSSAISGLVTESKDRGNALDALGLGLDSAAAPVTAPANYTATAYSLPGRTASGRRVTKGLIAADPGVLPLGSRVRLEAGSYSGEYTVADTGGAIRGKRIDIWTPSTRDANRFGRRTVKLVVLSYGPRRSSARKQNNRSAR